MFENFKNMFNQQNNQGEELFPFQDLEDENITEEMFEELLLDTENINIAATTSTNLKTYY